MNLQKMTFFLMLCLSSSLFASPYVVGDSLEPVSLTDQHKKPGMINEATRVILFSRDKKGGELLSDALSSLPKSFLTEHKIVYISDISGMPGLIAKYMAIPAMLKKSFSMLLDRDGNSTKNYPDKKDMGTLIVVKSLQITKVIHSDSIEAIVNTLTAP